MHWLVALMMLVTGVFHTPGHSFAFSTDGVPAVTVSVAPDKTSPEGAMDGAGCHFCLCVQVAGPAIPTGTPEPLEWQTESFAFADDDSPAEVIFLPLPRPPRG